MKKEKNREPKGEMIKTKEKKAGSGKVKKFFHKIGDTLKRKWLINGSKTIILVAIIVAIYVGVNIVLEKVVLPEYDYSPEKVYSISQSTKDKIGDTDKDVTIMLINYKDNVSLINFAERYTQLNSHFKLDRIDDVTTRPDIMQEYSVDSTSSGLVVIKSGDNEKKLTDNDFSTMDYSTYEQKDTTEEAITNAILNVTTEYKPKVYFMNTHTAYDSQSFTSILTAIETEATEVENLDILANGKVPEDCDCLIITTLKEDITEQERDKIIQYIKDGGELLLMCGSNIANIDLTNFQKVLDEYGVTIEKGVVFEGSASNMVAGYPDFVIEKVATNSLTKGLKMNLNFCLIDAAKIRVNHEKLDDLGVTWEQLASTSSDAFIRTDLTQTSPTRTDADSEKGSVDVAAILTKKIDDEKTSKLIIYGDELFAMDMPVNLGGYQMYTVNLYNNKDLILNSVSYLTERENTITIRKNYNTETYTVTEEQNRIIQAIIFVIPVLIIILGIVIWVLRRRKK